jgi:hypothetical protein
MEDIYIDQQAQVGGGRQGSARAARAAGRAIGPREGALCRLDIAVAEAQALTHSFDANGDDAAVCQGLEFVLLAQPVLVEVAPDAQAGKGRILGIDQPIAIADEFGQHVKAVTGLAAIALDGVHAKEFGAGVHTADGVEVAHQPAVVGLGPACVSFDSIAFVVEGHHRVAAACGFYAVQRNDTKYSFHGHLLIERGHQACLAGLVGYGQIVRNEFFGTVPSVLNIGDKDL